MFNVSILFVYFDGDFFFCLQVFASFSLHEKTSKQCTDKLIKSSCCSKRVIQTHPCMLNANYKHTQSSIKNMGVSFQKDQKFQTMQLTQTESKNCDKTKQKRDIQM